MSKIILLHYTDREAVGGVNRWVNDFISVFGEENCQSYSWRDVCYYNSWNPNDQSIPEWDKSIVLNQWLLWSKRINKDDIVIADNWWCDPIYQYHEKTICVAHGNWGHRTFDDIQKGISAEFPQHEEKQRQFREKYLKAGRKIVAVSDFIFYQMDKIWGFPSTVINNGIDLNKFKPATEKLPCKRPLIIHFTTTVNKGLEHIEALKKEVDADVYLLDEAAKILNLPKYEALAQADLVVHPSAHEGNSYAVLETLASGVPIISYDIGLMWKAKNDLQFKDYEIGKILDRNERSAELTTEWVYYILKELQQEPGQFQPRKWVEQFSLDNFHKNWQTYLQKEFGYGN